MSDEQVNREFPYLRRNSEVSEGNSSKDLLLASEMFEGAPLRVLYFGGVTILAYSDIAGAVQTQFSDTGLTGDWYVDETFPVTPGVAFYKSVSAKAKFFRVVYANGITDQTTFLLHTIVKERVTNLPIGAATDVNITAEAALTRATVESVGEELEVVITDQAALTRASGVALSAAEVANETAEHTLTRAQIDLTTSAVTLEGDQTQAAIAADQPRNITASALPAGAATEATLAAVDASVIKEGNETQAAIAADQPRNITASALPAGASTEATLLLAATDVNLTAEAVLTRAQIALVEAAVNAVQARTLQDAITGDAAGVNTSNELLVSLPSSIDSATNAINTLDYGHHEIHSGSHYTYRSVHALSKNATIDHLVITPNTTKWAHMVFSVGTIAANVEVELFKGATVSANGTLETAVNRNGNFPDASTTLVYENPTVTTTGPRISDLIIGTNDKKGAGGSARDANEFVLAQNTIYLLRITEGNVAATDVNINFDWYEHTNK